jgi:hypothetical protein
VPGEHSARLVGRESDPVLEVRVGDVSSQIDELREAVRFSVAVSRAVADWMLNAREQSLEAWARLESEEP